MQLNTDHLHRCVDTLEKSLALLLQSSKDSIEYEVYRNATVKGFELTLETIGKLLRKKLKPFFPVPKEVDELTYKEVFRHAHKHGLLGSDEVNRWFTYRENRNSTAHDYGIGFAEQTSKLLPDFLKDSKSLAERI